LRQVLQPELSAHSNITLTRHIHSSMKRTLAGKVSRNSLAREEAVAFASRAKIPRTPHRGSVASLTDEYESDSSTNSAQSHILEILPTGSPFSDSGKTPRPRNPAEPPIPNTRTSPRRVSPVPQLTPTPAPRFTIQPPQAATTTTQPPSIWSTARGMISRIPHPPKTPTTFGREPGMAREQPPQIPMPGAFIPQQQETRQPEHPLRSLVMSTISPPPTFERSPARLRRRGGVSAEPTVSLEGLEFRRGDCIRW